jgi:hypothetical protein
MSIEVHIEELVLHGFAPGDRYGVGEAVERTLAELLTEHGVPPSFDEGREVARLDGGAFPIAPESAIEAIGAQIASAVHRALGKQG